jgi:hypothetical protein
MGEYLHSRTELENSLGLTCDVHGGLSQRRDGLLTLIENLTSLSALGSILKDFWEPMSVGARGHTLG